MKQKFISGEGTTCIKQFEDLGARINVFLASGVRLTFPPQIQQSNEGFWYAALFYEQPQAPGINVRPAINDDDRAQHSLTREDVDGYEARNKAECESRGILYDGKRAEEKSDKEPYRRNMSL